jgi:hypothetical protein
VATLVIFRMLYFVIPFMISITILGCREIWLNVIAPWRARRVAMVAAIHAPKRLAPPAHAANPQRRSKG